MKIVEWQEQVTESGIQLGANTTVLKRGELLSTHAYPAADAAGRQGLITIVVVRVFENGRIMGLPADMCRYVETCPAASNFEPLKKSDSGEGC